MRQTGFEKIYYNSCRPSTYHFKDKIQSQQDQKDKKDCQTGTSLARIFLIDHFRIPCKYRKAGKLNIYKITECFVLENCLVFAYKCM